MKNFDFARFGQLVRKMRQDQGLSLAGLVDQLKHDHPVFRYEGIAEEGFLRQLEAGRRHMDVSTIYWLCVFFNEDFYEVIGECDLGYPKNMSFHDYLSTHLAGEREYMALSTAEVAVQLGITEEAYIDIEMGDAELPEALWPQVIDLLDLPLNDLWCLYRSVLEDSENP